MRVTVQRTPGVAGGEPETLAAVDSAAVGGEVGARVEALVAAAGFGGLPDYVGDPEGFDIPDYVVRVEQAGGEREVRFSTASQQPATQPLRTLVDYLLQL